jgi:phytoene synthase
MPFHASRGQIFLPEDVLGRHGAKREDILAGRDTPEIRAALAELRAMARDQLNHAGTCIRDICKQAVPAVLPVALVRLYLERMDRADFQPFEDNCVVPQWRRQWVLWKAARTATKVC